MSFKLKKSITGWAKRFHGVLQCLMAPVLTEVHKETMRKFLQTTKETFGDNGTQLREKVVTAYSFYQAAKVIFVFCDS